MSGITIGAVTVLVLLGQAGIEPGGAPNDRGQGEARAMGKGGPVDKTAEADGDGVTSKPADIPAASATGGSARTDGPSPGEMGMWLVNQARHQGHLLGNSDPRSASLHVIALLEGAKLVAPECPDAYYWLFDLYYRMGRTETAREALTAYVRLVPGDEAARIRLLEIELAERQTAEDRIACLKSELEQTGLPRAYASEVHRCLAELQFERREIQEAASDVEKALRLNPLNVPARRLAYQMFGETEAALQRVETALQLISINPSQVNVIWELGELLDQLSLHRHAQEFYTRAIDLHHRSAAGPVPAAYWYQLAVSYTRSGDWAEARNAATSALKINEALHVARLLRSTAAEKLREHEAAAEDLAFVGKAYEARTAEVREQRLYDEAAEIAWFYCYHRPNKEEALQLADLAMEEAKPGSLARLAYGYALRMNGRSDEAVKILKPLAAGDQLAAVELARILIDRGDKAEAVRILHKAAILQYTGFAHDAISELLTKQGETVSEPPLNTKITTALEKFHRDVFDYHQRPGDFLKFSLRYGEASLPPIGPLQVVFRVENAGPFTISFGEGYMARALVALSARLGGPEPMEFKHYLQVLMDSRPVLVPGDAIEKIVAVDVGPVQEYLRRTVSRPMEIELSALFDPVYMEGQLAAGSGTITAGPIKAVRSAVSVGPAGLGALLEAAGSPYVGERINAAETIAALLAEAAATSESKVADLPVEALSTALAGLLADPDWRVRARALVGAGWSPLDGRTTNAAAQAVRDPESPVVKMLAVRLFAQQHGEKFQPVLQQLGRGDPSRCVRIMSLSFLPDPVGVQANKAGARSEEPLP